MRDTGVVHCSVGAMLSLPMQSFVEIVDVCVVMLGSGGANC